MAAQLGKRQHFAHGIHFDLLQLAGIAFFDFRPHHHAIWMAVLAEQMTSRTHATCVFIGIDVFAQQSLCQMFGKRHFARALLAAE